jgi:hypothetical protein
MYTVAVFVGVSWLRLTRLGLLAMLRQRCMHILRQDVFIKVTNLFGQRVAVRYYR